MNDNINEKSIESGIVLRGSWELHAGRFTYKPCHHSSHGLLLFSERMVNGRLSAHVKVNSFLSPSSSENSCLRFVFGYNNSNDTYYTAGIGGYNRAYVLSLYINDRWILLNGLFDYTTLTHFQGKDLFLELKIQGLEVQIFINHVSIFTGQLPFPLQSSGLGLFAWGSSEIEITDIKLTHDPLTAFMILPFTPHYDRFFENVIKPITKLKDVVIKRCCDIMAPTSIYQDIITELKRSDIIIADITERNPNVFYEVGYAHALQKEIILLSERTQLAPIPFDIQSNRVVVYDNLQQETPFIENFLGHIDYFRKKYGLL